MKLVKGIWFPDSDTHFEKMIDDEGNYQKKQFDTVMKYIKPEDRGLFIDVGAHVGLWSRMAIKNGFKRIVGFEPSNQNSECFYENLEELIREINGYNKFDIGTTQSKIIYKHSREEFRKRVTLLQCGLSDCIETKALITKRTENSGSVELTNSDCEKANQFCALGTFDEDLRYDTHLLVEEKYKTLIKIDVQGYEAKVVRGMTNFIKEYRPIIIVEQWLNGKEDLEATKYCESLGMKILERVQKEVILGW